MNVDAVCHWLPSVGTSNELQIRLKSAEVPSVLPSGPGALFKKGAILCAVLICRVGGKKAGTAQALPFIFFFLKIYLFNFFFGCTLGLHCCMQAFSSFNECSYSSLWCAGFSLQWLLLLGSTGSRHPGFSSFIRQSE